MEITKRCSLHFAVSRNICLASLSANQKHAMRQLRLGVHLCRHLNYNMQSARAHVTKCTWCKVRMLQSAHVVNCNGCKVYVLQSACVAKCMCYKAHMLSSACVATKYGDKQSTLHLILSILHIVSYTLHLTHFIWHIASISQTFFQEISEILF